MIHARMPDGTILRFPDGTADDVVDRAAQAHLRQSQPPGAGERFAMGAGDIARGIEQIGARAIERGRGGWLNRLLRSSPEVAANMDAAAQVVPPPTAAGTDARIQQREAEYQARRGPDAGIDWMRMGGNAAVSLPVALMTPAGAGLGGAIASGALQGAALSGLQPVTAGDFAETKRAQLETGAMFGAAGGAAGNMLGRALSPRPAPGARALSDAGVELTPGQMIGGAAQRIEDRLTSVPVVGDTIRTAQRRGVESLNRATASRVLREIGEEVPDNMPVGREMVEHVAQRTGRAYDDAISRVRPFGPDQQFAQDMAAAARQFVTPARRQAFMQFLRENVVSRMRGGQIDGDTFKQVDSVLGQLVRSARSTTNLADREVGEMAQVIQRGLRDLAARTNPQAAPAIRAADAAYAANVRLQAAAGGVGARDGVFSGPQFAAAVRANDPSLRHNAYARGNALLQDISDPAASVLPSTVPNSGTPERMMLAALLGGAGNAAGFVSWPALAAGAAGAASYTRPATQILQAILMRNPSMAARLSGNALARSGGALTAPLAAALLAPSPPQRLDQRR